MAPSTRNRRPGVARTVLLAAVSMALLGAFASTATAARALKEESDSLASAAPPSPAAPPPYPQGWSPTPSCGIPVQYTSGGPWSGNRPANDDTLFDLFTDVCNFIADKYDTCCWFVDLYGDSAVVKAQYPQFLPLAQMQLVPGQSPSVQVLSSSAWQSVDMNTQICNNLDNANTTVTCAMSHAVTRGTSTTVSHTNTVGSKLGVSTKTAFNLPIASGELSVSVELNYQWSETASTTVSKTETDSFQYTVPVPPGQCFKLWLQNAETTTTARLVQQANVTRSIAMFFGGPGAPVRFQATNNGWFWASGWLQLAQQLGYQLSPWFASLQDNVWEKVDLVDVTYFDAKAWMTTLKPTDPQCQTGGGVVLAKASEVTAQEWARAVPVKLTKVH